MFGGWLVEVGRSTKLINLKLNYFSKLFWSHFQIILYGVLLNIFALILGRYYSVQWCKQYPMGHKLQEKYKYKYHTEMENVSQNKSHNPPLK